MWHLYLNDMEIPESKSVTVFRKGLNWIQHELVDLAISSITTNFSRKISSFLYDQCTLRFVSEGHSPCPPFILRTQ